MMRRATIKINGVLAGILTENDRAFLFEYDKNYLQTENARPVSLTLPLTEEPYESEVLFAFFDGLIPEGWMLELAQTNWKLNPRDRMGLLLACCRDCIGNIEVEPLSNTEEA
jgi:serine/threonine-protein kinase HipA